MQERNSGSSERLNASSGHSRTRDTPRAMPKESTTPDPAGLARGLFETARRRDFDALLRLYAPDVVWDMSPLGGLGSFEGHVATRGFWEDWYDSYEDLDFEVQEVLDLGDRVNFAVVPQDGRPVGSTGRVQLRAAWVSVWVQGKIMRVTQYLDIDAARAAAERVAEERG
jgi:ketosteroid isomerase-like protein